MLAVYRLPFIAAFLLVSLAFVKPATAGWNITYNPSSPDYSPDDKNCNPNQTVNASRTVTIRATITWNGANPAPKKLTVREVSQVSWSAEIHRPQDGIVKGEPVPIPLGDVGGMGSTGLDNPQTVLTPAPQTDVAKGAIITGRRITSYTVSDGTLTPPSVTLSASAFAMSSDMYTTGSAHATCLSYSVSTIEIWRDGVPLAGDNAKALPGQFINLVLSGATADGGEYAWNTPELAFNYYDHTASENQLDTVLQQEGAAFYFYWTEGKDDERIVTCALTIEGQEVTVEGVIKVFKPQSTFKGTGGFISATGLQVDLIGLDPFPHGMAWDETTVSVPWSSGEFCFFQIETSLRSGDVMDSMGNVIGRYKTPDSGSSGLDGGAPYGGSGKIWQTSQVVGRPIVNGQPLVPTAGDTPGQGLYIDQTPPLELKNLTVNDSFTTWLMFLPAGNESCYVPLKKFDWSWGVVAHRVQSGPVVVDSPTPPINQTGSDTTEFPQWSSVISPGAEWVPTG